MLQEIERQLEILSDKKNALLKEIEEIEKRESALLLEKQGLIQQRDYGYKCAVINPDSNMILKTVIEINDEDYRAIEDFHDNIKFNEYYVDGEKFDVGFTRERPYSYILLNYKYEIGNERKFILDNQQYKVSRRERGYDRSDIYYSWKIPVEIPFSWIEE
jgi:hypothetical protein